MLELIVAILVIGLGVMLLVGLFKFCVMLILLPLKIVLGLAKGLLGLLVIVPALVLGALALAGLAPVLLALALPLVIAVALIGGLFSFLFCS